LKFDGIVPPHHNWLPFCLFLISSRISSLIAFNCPGVGGKHDSICDMILQIAHQVLAFMPATVSNLLKKDKRISKASR
jgi:hypothetical protein